MWMTVYLATLLVLAVANALPLSASEVTTSRSHWVPFASLEQCPVLEMRSPLTRSAGDVRPDEITVMMAMGDSITAGALARNSPEEGQSKGKHRWSQHDHANLAGSSGDQLRFPGSLPIAREYRGVSYPIGGDEGAITLYNIAQHWNTNITGSSRGHTPAGICTKIGGCNGQRFDHGLNAAVSGSTTENLFSQAIDLLSRREMLGIDDDGWTFVNVGIGANDICAFCLAPNITGIPLVGTPDEFSRGIKSAVELLRKRIPRLLVNISRYHPFSSRKPLIGGVVGVFRVSAIYDLTLKDPYCRGPFLPPIPHLPTECSCAFTPGPVGDYTRSKMDSLGESYDDAVKRMVTAWNDEEDEGFGVSWQSGLMVDLANWPIEALSPMDCFHPSEKAHQRVAAGLWNRLSGSQAEKSQPMKWEEEVMVKCLSEGDRITLGVE